MMLARLFVFIIVLAFQAQADVFHLPVHAVQQDLATLIKRNEQAFLDGNTLNRYSPFLPNGFIYENSLFMMVELGLGTPPEQFYVILSLKQSDLFVLSKHCEDPNYRGRKFYDATKSSTYVDNGTSVDVPFWNVLAKGFTSRDTISLGIANVMDQTFLEATTVEISPSYHGIYFDGALGLGPKYGNSSTGFGNLASSLYFQGFISKNVFSMVLPRRVGELGEIAFGFTNSDIGLDDVAMIPVTNVTGIEYLTNAWQVSASYVKLGSGTVLNRTLDGFTAILETEFPFIGLPTDVVDQMHEYMGARRIGWGLVFAVDCDIRESLADLVFNLGGYEVRITPFDYTKEYSGEGIERECISMLMDFGPQDEEEPMIALGVGFMLGVRTVFDLERNMVGFVELLHRS